VRDPISQNLLSKIDIDASLGFDSLPLHIADHYKDFILEKSQNRKNIALFAGSSAFANKNPELFLSFIDECEQNGLRPICLLGAPFNEAQDDDLFIKALSQYKGEAGTNGAWDLIKAETFEEWLQYLCQARILISGRFHYNLLVSLYRIS